MRHGLLVEDQPEVRSVVQKLLARHGYTVLAAGNGEEALRAAREHHGRIDLLITDVVMPDMNGHTLAEQFLRQWPEARELYMSGYTNVAIVQRGIIERSLAFIQKPFTPTGLLRKIREVLSVDPPPDTF